MRNANAFLAAEVHIVGKRRWNSRGAMVTDRYQHVRHHPTLATSPLGGRARPAGVGVDNLPGSVADRRVRAARRCVLLFGQEGPGLSETRARGPQVVLHIPQFGSTRSINAGVASAIAMYEWIRRFSS